MFACVFITSPVHLFIQQVLSEFLLYAKHCALGPQDCTGSLIRQVPVTGSTEEADIN